MSFAVCLQKAVDSIHARFSNFRNESIIIIHSEAWAHIPCHQNKQSFPGFIVSKLHNIWGFWRALPVPDSRRQTQGGHPPHAHTHTHSLTHTVSMGNLGTERTVGLYVCCWQHYSCEQHVRLALKARRMPLLSPLAFSPHFLKGNCLLSSLMSMASPHRAANAQDGQLKIQTGKPAGPLSLQRETELLWKPQGWLFCYFSPVKRRTKCTHTLV